MKKILSTFILAFWLMAGGTVFAQVILNPTDASDAPAGSPAAAVQPSEDASRASVLPDTSFNMSVCEVIMQLVERFPEPSREVVAKRGDLFPVIHDLGKHPILKAEGVKSISHNDILACGIKTGQMAFWMIPFYIRTILEFIIGLAGLVSIGGLIFGGYMYLFAGLGDDKEKGKNAIKNSLIGLVLVLTAWAIVSIVITFVAG